MSYVLAIELLSEAIFSSGQSTPGEVDIEILHDRYGFPYYGARSIKGNLREQADNVAKLLSHYDDELKGSLLEAVQVLFGQAGMEEATQGILQLSDAKLPPQIRSDLKLLVEANELHKDDILNALTDIRFFTAIDPLSGTAKSGSLRQARVVEAGIVLYSELTTTRELSELELAVLCTTISQLRHIGSMRHRGKGNVLLRLYQYGQDITLQNIESLKRLVSTHE